MVVLMGLVNVCNESTKFNGIQPEEKSDEGRFFGPLW